MEICRRPSLASNQTIFGLGRAVWADGLTGGLDLDTSKTNDFGQKKKLAIFCATFSRANHLKKPPTLVFTATFHLSIPQILVVF